MNIHLNIFLHMHLNILTIKKIDAYVVAFSYNYEGIDASTYLEGYFKNDKIR